MTGCEPPEEDTLGLVYRRRTPVSAVKDSAASAPVPAGDAGAPGPAAEEAAAPAPKNDQEPTVESALENLERSEGDARLIARAREDPDFMKHLLDLLAEDALPLIKSLISSGRMWREARAIGIPAPSIKSPPLNSDEVASLAGEVIARAYRKFETHGLEKWSQTEGKSLRAFFVNDCKYQFSNAVQMWSRDRETPTRDRDFSLDVEDVDLDSTPHRPVFGSNHPVTPETVVVESMELERRLGQIESRFGARARLIVEQRCLHERTFTEIARDLNISRKKASEIYNGVREEFTRRGKEE